MDGERLVEIKNPTNYATLDNEGNLLSSAFG